MFDMFSKLGEIKEKASKLKEEVMEKEFSKSFLAFGITIIVNGKKDIIDIRFDPTYYQLSEEEQRKALLTSINEVQAEAEKFIIEKIKSIVPNIPGLNIFG